MALSALCQVVGLRVCLNYQILQEASLMRVEPLTDYSLEICS